MGSFDTHAEIEALMGEGMAKNTAVAIVRSIQKSRESDLNNLASKEQVAVLEKDVENIMQHSATKADLLETEKKLDEKINSVYNKLDEKINSTYNKLDEKINSIYNRLDEKIHNSERRLMLMIGGSIVTTSGIIIGALKYFLHI